MAATAVAASATPVNVGVEAPKARGHVAKFFGGEDVLVASGHNEVNNGELDSAQKYFNKNNIYLHLKGMIEQVEVGLALFRHHGVLGSGIGPDA